LSQFKNKVEDTEAEAMRTGTVANPIPQEEFTTRLGDEVGTRAYERHAENVQLGADIATVAGMNS
jgi:hypothetical protein